MNECVVCFKQSETLCQRCRTPYCSRRCQTEDWPEHKAMCIPMPLLAAEKNRELPKSNHQLNQSGSNKAYKTLKPRENGRPQNPLQKVKGSVPNIKQQTGDSEKPKRHAKESVLRLPKSKLPALPIEVISPVHNTVSSAMFNPFKRNSQNIGFNANAVIPSVNETKKTEAQPSPRKFVPVVGIPSKEILEETPLPAPVQADETEKAEIITRRSLHKLSLHEVKQEVVEQKHEKMFTMKDIEIVPLTVGKKMVCLDSSNIDKGYVSACVNDGKAVAFIDRMSSKIGAYCNTADDCYRPQIGELCLCLFDEDNEWYRAVVLDKIESEIFRIKFIDFGNESTASAGNIRKMPQEFLHPCLENQCHIKGFHGASREEKFKMERFFVDNPIFEVEKLKQMESGMYKIQLNC